MRFTLNKQIRRYVVFATQPSCCSPDVDPEEDRLPMLRRIEELSQVFTDPDSRAALSEATESVISNNHYRCLKALRALLPREERLMAVRSQ